MNWVPFERIESWTKGWRGFLSLFFLVLCAWFPTLHGGVNSVDSNWLVRDNPLLNLETQLHTVELLNTIFLDLSLDTRLVLGAEYLPIRDLSVWLDFRLFGDNYHLHHLVNLLWYSLSVAGVFVLCGRFFGEGVIAWFTTCLFAVHPTHVESVAWLASRKDLLGFALLIAAFLYFLSTRHRGSLIKMALFIPAITLASIWSKNTSVILPGILAVSSVLFLKANLRDLRWWLSWVPLGVVALATTALSTSLGGRVGIYAAPRAEGLFEAISLQGALLSHYLQKLFLPIELAPFYSEPQAFSMGAIIGIILGCALVFSAISLRKRSPVFTLGVTILLLGLLPVSMLVPLQNLVADRYLLIPSLGFCLMLGATIQNLSSSFPKAGPTACTVTLLLFTIQTHTQSTLWRDEGALWTHNIDVQPQVQRGWTLLAKNQEANGDVDAAIETLSLGLESNPEGAGLLQSRGAIYINIGQLDMAESDLRLALSIEPWRREAAHNLATVLMKTNRFPEAVSIARKLVETHPQYPRARNTYGAILLNVGDLTEAEAQLLIAESMIWKDAEVACNLGSIGWLRAQGAGEDQAQRTQGEEMAKEWWEECLLRDPKMEYAARGLDALSNLGQ